MARNQMTSWMYFSRTQIVLFIILTTAITSVSLNEVSEGVRRVTNVSAGLELEQIWKFLLDNFSASKGYLTGSDIDRLVEKFQRCSNAKEKNEENNSVGENPLRAVLPFKSVKSCEEKECNNTDTDVVKKPGNNEITSPDYIELLKLNTPCKTPSWKSTNFNYNSMKSVIDICDQILYHIANPQCCGHPVGASAFIQDPVRTNDSNFGGESVSHSKEKPATWEVWVYGLGFVTVINFCSLAGVCAMPFIGKEILNTVLIVMVGLAVGSLTGSSLFHLLPQAFDMSANDPNHEYLFTSLVACGGIWLFFSIERTLNMITACRKRRDDKSRRGKSSFLSTTPENSTISMLVDNGSGKGELKDVEEGTNTTGCSQIDNGVMCECQEQVIKSAIAKHELNHGLGDCERHHVEYDQGTDSVIATVAWMIIFGDGIHNFIDGLSIGAAFSENIMSGVGISIAVLCEELPHELGDYAVLVNAGMTPKQALVYNFLSALTCYLGFGIGVVLGELEASSYIFAVAGGMFLYIALVDMVPTMNKHAKEANKISVTRSLKILLLQNIGMILGVSLLFLLAKHQDGIQF